MGEVFAGHYELVDLVGAGSSGAVWRAWDHRQQTYVCAKLMRQHDAAGLVRFVREHSGSLRHPHVLLPRAWAGAEEQVLFAADLVRGGSAADLLAERGPLPDFLVAQLAEQVLSALSAVHRRGLVHRDIRTGNLLLEPTGAERPHCWLSGFSAVAVGSPGEDLRQLGAVAAELGTGLYPDPATGPGPAPAHLPEQLWTWIRRMTGHVDPATAPFATADEARVDLAATGLILRTWPVTDLRVPDRLGELPVGWAPDGPGADRTSAGVDPSIALGEAQESPAVVYEEIPSLPHVVPPVAGDLSDSDVSDDDGFGELAELLPSDPAYADSVVGRELVDAGGSELAEPGDLPPERLPVAPTAAPGPVDRVSGHVGQDSGAQEWADSLDQARSNPAQPEPEQLGPEQLEPEQEVEPAQLANRTGFAPPAEPDAGDEPEDAHEPDDRPHAPEAEEFQSRPIRVPHPPRATRSTEEPFATIAGPADATAQSAQAPRTEQPDGPVPPPALSRHQPEIWHTGEWLAEEWPAPDRPELPGSRAAADRPEAAAGTEPPVPAASERHAAPDRPAGEPAPEPPSAAGGGGVGWPEAVPPGEPDRPYRQPPRAGSDEPAPDLPPLDLDETEPSAWRRVLLVSFAIVALVGALAGTWYLVMRYR